MNRIKLFFLFSVVPYFLSAEASKKNNNLFDEDIQPANKVIVSGKKKETNKLQKLQDEVESLKNQIQNLQKQNTSKKEFSPENEREATVVKPNKEEEDNEESSKKRPPKVYSNARRKGFTVQKLGGDNIGRRYAIVVGINNYEDISISNLVKARNDAIIMANLLKSKGQFDKVFLMTDDVNNKGPKRNLYPTRLNILAKIDSVLNFATPKDMVLFFFSGHGISDYDENGYLVTVDTLSQHKFNSSLKVHEIVSRFRQKGIKKSLLILDACRDKIYTSKSTAQNPLRQERFSAAEVAATFYSTKAGYYSYEDDKSDFGVFTKYLVYGVEGKADSNKDSVVTFSELKSYVQESVREWSLQNNKKQKPYVKIYGESYGDLAISLSPKPPAKGESLADKKIPKKTRRPYIWRSAVFPGWGQFHDGSKNRGYAYMASGLLLGSYYLSNRLALEKYQSDYNSSFVLPGSLLAPTFVDFQKKKDDLVKQEAKTSTAYYLFMSFWAWNIYDAAVFDKQKGFKVWEFAFLPQVPVSHSHLLAKHRLWESQVQASFTFRF
ncbi:MAG: caspase family protein [Spirochaetota bacterium]